MSWNEQTGTVTRAFDDWTLADRDIRAFRKVSNQFAQKEYDRIEHELMNSPGDPDGPDFPTFSTTLWRGCGPPTSSGCCSRRW
jgi:hypothetical protein